MNHPAHGDAHWLVQHDAIAYAYRNKRCVHDLGLVVCREVGDLFQKAVPLGNTVYPGMNSRMGAGCIALPPGLQRRDREL